ncbi:MAG: hypothetical protein EAX96_12180 [Candidatus Lokiarchaeota archaeon]|nr:hypothetical protein [Candidatus Lokiarchaeota archaeon]
MIELDLNNSTSYINKLRNNEIFPVLKLISNEHAKISSKFHIWWAKKPGNIIKILIQHFTKPNEIVLDPFSGSGAVLEEAIKLGRKSIALDLNPLSIFLMENLISKKNWELIQDYYEKILKNLKDKCKIVGLKSIFDLYETNCPICKGIARINYVIWEDDTPIAVRLYCIKDGILTKNKIEKKDIELINEIEKINWKSKINNVKFIQNSRINVSKNMYLMDFFTKRNFLALSSLIDEINSLSACAEREFLKFIFSSTLRKTSKLISTKGGLSLGFWIPKKNRKENNVFFQFEKVKDKLWRKKNYLDELNQISKRALNFSELKTNKNLLIKKFNATELIELIEPESIDLIVTDPPYADEVPYFELTQLWNPWLDFEISHIDLLNEIILTNSPERIEKNVHAEEGVTNYRSLLESSFKQMFQTLKNHHYACVWFKEAELKIWNFLIESALNAGFVYLDQINVNTDIRSLKPKFSPKHSLTGHVLIFFLKDKNLHLSKVEPDWNLAVKLICMQAERIILKNGGKATTSELYNGIGIKEQGIIAQLIKNNALKLISNRYDNLFYFFKKHFKFDKESYSWFIN